MQERLSDKENNGYTYGNVTARYHFTPCTVHFKYAPWPASVKKLVWRQK